MKGEASAQVEGGVPETVRADLWLWAVRIYKTRSLAAAACRKGQVRVQGQSIKPARNLRAGDELHVERGYLMAHFRVRALLEQRVGAKLVGAYLEDLTTDEEREKARLLAEQNRPLAHPANGKGRPTKKDRRQMEEWSEAEAGPLDLQELKAIWKKAIQ